MVPIECRWWRVRCVLVVSLMIVMTLPLHTTSAANHALLVGVADYPSLAAKFQLQGPSNDVALMRAVLAARDFLPENITTLVSGGETPPTRAAILIALERLAQRAERGDFVYLHLAGHGSQQPSGVDDTDETDGLDEIFLPQDVGQWEDKIGAVNKAIVDNEIRSHIAAIRTKGAFVWAVFDSCHSGTMLRAARRTRFRNVDAAALGVPEQGRRGHQRRGEAVPMGVDRLGEDAGGFIAFYAAQAFEPAPELTMPIDGAVAKPHGLFSYSLAEALANGGGMSYRQLGEAILQKYASLRIFRTTPLFEGTHLDAPIYGTRAGPAVRQWKLVLRGSKSKPMAYVRAGELQQIGTGSVFALLTDPLAADEEAIDYAQARDIELFGSRLEPLASAERAPPDVTKLSKNLYARLVKPVFQFDLKVAMPADGSALGARERDTLTAIKTLAANRPSTIDEGLKINWVTAAEEADLYLSFTPRQDAQDCPRDHLWFLNRTGGLVCDGARRTLSLRIEQPSANFMRNLQTQLLKHLQAIGKARNLENMVQSFQGGAFARSVEVKLFINPIAGGARRETDLSSMPHLRAGDELRLDVTNLSKRPMDITILFVDSQYGIEAMFPTHGHTGRLEAGGFTSANGWVNESTIGIEGMIVIAVEASKWAAPADFSFLQQPRLSSTVNVRGAAGMRPVGDIERMFREAGFGAPAATRSAGSGKRRTPFNRVAVKSVRWLVE